MQRFRYIAFGALGVLLVLFVLSNRESVVVQLLPLPYEMELSVALLFLLGFLLGLGTAWIAGLFGKVRSRSRRRQAEQRAKSLEKEVSTLESELSSDADAKPGKRLTDQS